MADAPGYGLWSLVIINSAIFVFFAASFARPSSPRDWRTFGAFSAFVVALFTEMYGFPLTIYVLSGWLQTHYPGIDFLSHDAGHLLETLLGWRTNPPFGPFHIASNLLIACGFILLVRLARFEEREALAKFGNAYRTYAAATPAFIPAWPRIASPRDETPGG